MKNLDYWVILSLFGGYTLKLLVLGANPADAAVVLVLAGALLLNNIHVQSKKILELEQALKEIKTGQFDQNIIISELKATVTGIKLSGSLRQAK